MAALLYLLSEVFFQCSVCGMNGLRSVTERSLDLLPSFAFQELQLSVPTQKFTLLPPFYPMRHAHEEMYQAHSYSLVPRPHSRVRPGYEATQLPSNCKMWRTIGLETRLHVANIHGFACDRYRRHDEEVMI